jgi:hypothetical protein
MEFELPVFVPHYGVHSSKWYWLLQLSAEAFHNSICTAQHSAAEE